LPGKKERQDVTEKLSRGDVELEAWRGGGDWVKACREVSWEDSRKRDEEA